MLRWVISGLYLQICADPSWPVRSFFLQWNFRFFFSSAFSPFGLDLLYFFFSLSSFQNVILSNTNIYFPVMMSRDSVPFFSLFVGVFLSEKMNWTYFALFSFKYFRFSFELMKKCVRPHEFPTTQVTKHNWSLDVNSKSHQIAKFNFIEVEVFNRKKNYAVITIFIPFCWIFLFLLNILCHLAILLCCFLSLPLSSSLALLIRHIFIQCDMSIITFIPT